MYIETNLSYPANQPATSQPNQPTSQPSQPTHQPPTTHPPPPQPTSHEGGGVFLSKLFTFCGGSRARFAHPHFCDTWRSGFRPQKCLKSVQNVVSSRRKWVGGRRPLRCIVFPYFGLSSGTFLGKMKLKSVSAPLLVFTCSPVFCFSAFGAFLFKNAIFNRGLLL